MPDEIIDQHGHHHPKTYRVQIDKDFFDVDEAEPTGQKLLEIAGKQPPEGFALYLKHPGGQPRRIPLKDRVDLRAPGTEKFVTLPLDQTEGSR